ncbi:MAG: histidine kinase [Spirochaetaceae bacterium]|nr:histidine kinase [Spirochaetaceae bacterium]
MLQQYSQSKISSRQSNILVEIKDSIIKIQEKIPNLDNTFKDSSSLYFLYRALDNGTNYLADHMDNLDNTRSKNQYQFYKEYLILDNVYKYLGIYSDQYLTALVIKNANNLGRDEIIFRQMKLLIYIIIAFLVIIYIFIANKLAKQLIKPIDIMVNEANKITHGILDDKDITIQGLKEYEFLEDSMNQMKHSLSNRLVLMRENAELEKVLHEKQLASAKMEHELESARLVSLQNQINPHFFFNTLNTLRMMCIIENAHKSVSLVSDFASFFRYTLKHTEQVTIKEEIFFIEKYINLQIARFADKLTYSINVDEICNSQIIPPLIIQPLVENAIKYGIEEKEGTGKVTINITKENKRVIIKVIDNGVGIDENISLILSDPLDRTHIGLKNIRDRLELFYKNKANLKVNNNVSDYGTIAIISIPFIGENNV